MHVLTVVFFLFVLVNPYALGREVTMPMDYSGAEVYAQYCARCHTNAVGGAPRPGKAQDWIGRAGNRRSELLLAVLKGKGGMPPKGGNASLSVSEANAALDFMMTSPDRR